MADLKLEYKFSPTVEAYIMSEKTINVLISSTGEGKTFGSIGAVIQHAKRCNQPIRIAIVRDTLENIKLSIVPSIQEFFEKYPKAYRFKNEFKELTLFTEPRIDCDLFGIDDPASLGKLQGSSAYSLIWLNEPAPISDKSNAGLSEEVYNAALLRCVRRKGTPGRLQVDMNPADEEHWTYRRFVEDPDVIPEFPLIQKQVWFIPYGENRDLGEDARQAAILAYKDDPASYARYVEGKFATVYRGEKVAQAYDQKRHFYTDQYGRPTPIIPAKGLVSFAFFDSWHTPACVLGQKTQTGRLIFMDTLRLEGSDIRTLIKTQVIPMLESPKWKDKPNSWRIGGDFTMLQHDQSNRNESAAKAVEDAFRKYLKVPGIFFEAGPSKWETMKRHFNAALQGSDYLGQPLVLLSGDNKILDKGLRGSWHYKTDNAGNVHRNAKPDKDIHSHACDGWANAVSVLLPSVDVRVNMAAYRKTMAQAKARVATYATGGYRG
jgi:Phage terminase large subunit